jgi:hypothetical protein
MFDYSIEHVSSILDPPDPTPHQFPGHAEIRKPPGRIIGKGLYWQISEPEMPFKVAKEPRITSISKIEIHNSPKTATIQKPTRQIRLRSENKAFYIEIVFQVFSCPRSRRRTRMRDPYIEYRENQIAKNPAIL